MFGPLQYLSLDNGFLILLVWFAASLFALVLHNITQALVARALGDSTAVNMGFAETDPRKHIDPIQLLFMILLGGAFPLPITLRASNLRGRGPWSEVLVWVSGSLGMLLWGLLLTIAAVLLVRFGGENNTVEPIVRGLLVAAGFAVRFAVIYLVPVPPMNGARILHLVGNEQVRQVLRQIESYGFMGFFIIFFILSATGILGWLTTPILDLFQRIAGFFA
jgi:Zn-dependent protease